MQNPLYYHAFVTIIAVMCCAMVWHERSKGRFSQRATVLMLSLGPFSWLAQMWLLNHIDTENELVSQYLFFCIAAALVCFALAISANQSSRISGRDVAWSIVWGQFVFPLVLISFLPDGMMSFIELLTNLLNPPH